MIKKIAACLLALILATSTLIVFGKKVSADGPMTGTGGSVVYTLDDMEKKRLTAFIPDESGYYLLYSKDIQGNGYAYMSDAFGPSMKPISFKNNYKDDYNSFWVIMYLEGGKKYLFQPDGSRVETGDNTTADFSYTFCIRKYEINVTGKITAKGGSEWITSDKINSKYTIKITPETSGYYWCWFDNPIGNIEPWAYMYDSNDNMIGSTSAKLIPYEDHELRLYTTWLEAGKDYYLKPISRGDSKVGDECKFTLGFAKVDAYFENPGIEYVLTDPNKDIVVNPKFHESNTLPFSIMTSNPYTHMTEIHPELKKIDSQSFCIPGGVKEYTDIEFDTGTENTFCFRKTFYVFVMPESPDGTLVPGQTLHVSDSAAFDRIGGGKISKQWIYSYTPEKSGTIKLTSSNIENGYPTMVLFDKDYKFIKAAGGSEYLDVNEELPDTYVKENVKSVTLEAYLEGGKTYYFAIPLLNYGLCPFSRTCLYGVTNDWSVDFTVDPNAPTPSKSGTFEDFVERLYVVALERASEPEGKAFWCEKVQDGTYDGAYCARFFLTSPEFLGKNKSDEQFVDTLYRTFFDRESDDEGRAFWVEKLKTSSRESIVEGFINSTEWCNICASYGVKSGAQWAKATVASANATAFATRLYTECLGRSPEEGGLNYWSLSLTNLERTGTQAAKEFFYSEEFLGKNLSNEDYVMRLYKTFMGREPESEGKAYWLDLLNNGGSRDEVFNFFSSCPEFTEICTKYAIDR